jgi:hypothetical protein
MMSAVAASAMGVGTSGADFLSVGVGARALAMGSAFTAVDTGLDANTVNWNPGGLGFVEGQNITASYNALMVDENQGYLGYAAPVGANQGVWATGVNYLMISNIQRRAGDTETADSTFASQNFAVNGSYGKALSDSLAVGGSVKYIREALDTYHGNGAAVDAGVLWRTPVKGLSAGAALSNLGSKIGPDALPLAVKGGVAYKLFNDSLILASDYDWLINEQTSYVSIGEEYWINRILAMRAGYQFGHGADQLQSKTVGLGVGIGLKLERRSVDYAFLPYGDLGNTHRITLGVKF